MRKLVAAWVTIWAVIGLGLWQADKHNVACCKAVRHLFKTDTPAGKLRFTIVYITGFTSLWRHICKKVEDLNPAT